MPHGIDKLIFMKIGAEAAVLVPSRHTSDKPPEDGDINEGGAQHRIKSYVFQPGKAIGKPWRGELHAHLPLAGRQGQKCKFRFNILLQPQKKLLMRATKIWLYNENFMHRFLLLLSWHSCFGLVWKVYNYLIRSIALKNRDDRFKNNLYISPQRIVKDIPVIKFDSIIIVCDIRSSADLP